MMKKIVQGFILLTLLLAACDSQKGTEDVEQWDDFELDLAGSSAYKLSFHKTKLRINPALEITQKFKSVLDEENCKSQKD